MRTMVESVFVRVAGTRRVATILGAILAAILAARPARAHLVAAQRGTIHLAEDGAYLVLSLPLSAFPFLDTDGDGAVDAGEIGRGSAAIEERVRKGVSLRDTTGSRPLEGILLAPSPSSDEPGAALRQVVVLGRFALDPAAPSAPLRLAVRLRGASEDEQVFEVAVRRGSVRETLRFDASHEEREVLSGGAAPRADAVRRAPGESGGPSLHEPG